MPKNLVINSEVNDVLEKYFDGELDMIKLSKVEKLYDEGDISENMKKFLKKLKQEHAKSKTNASKYNIIYRLDEPVMEDSEELNKQELEKLCKGENVKSLEERLEKKKNEIKTLKKKLMFCKSRGFKYGNDITLEQLIKIIKDEKKSSVQEFLDIFPTVSDTKGKLSKNHVFEALWILSYYFNLDIVGEDKKGINRVFYKSTS